MTRPTLRRTAALVALAAVPLAVLGVFFGLPVAGMIERGLVEDGRLDLAGVLEVLTRERTLRVLWFTLWSSAAGTAVSLGLGLPAAYALHRLDFRGRAVLRALMLIPFVMPTLVVGVAFQQLARGPLGALEGSPLLIVAGLAFFNIAVVVRAVGAAWESLDQRPAEAAAALGASPAQVLRTVTLPALRPAIVGAASVVFLFCATAFGIVLVLGGLRYATVETEIYLLTTTLFDLRGAAALSLLQLLVVLVLLGVARAARSTPDPTVSRTVVRPRRPRRVDAPALGATLLVLVLVGVPIATLVAGSLQRDGRWGLGNYRALADDADGALVAPVTDALAASLRTAADATWMSLALGLLVAILVTRRSRGRGERRLRGFFDAVFMLPLGVSAVTVGFGLLITLDGPPLDLRDSPLLVPIAQALVALPLVVRTLVPVLAGIDDRQRQAAASLGAPPWRALLTVDVPVVWKPLLAAGGFAFAVSLGEFGATAFLARSESPTLPVVIYDLLSTPGEHHYGVALAASCVLAATTAVVVLAVERLRVPSVGAF